MNGIVDFHTHAFPDQIAEAAIASLEQAGGIKAHGLGTVAGLLRAMDESGIATSVLCSIATRPGHFHPILDWSKAIRSQRIIPLPSVHPDDPLILEHVGRIHAEGFAGIKMHAYYQHCALDDPRLADCYALLAELGMLLVIHAGYDIAYPRVRLADPTRIAEVCHRFPELRLIATHLGGWEEWDEVEALLVGQPIYMELSFGLNQLEPGRLRRILLAHPAEYLLFGTDAPWNEQAEALQLLRRLDLPAARYEQITTTNARRLLDQALS